jgi:hypothetical protein
MSKDERGARLDNLSGGGSRVGLVKYSEWLLWCRRACKCTCDAVVMPLTFDVGIDIFQAVAIGRGAGEPQMGGLRSCLSSTPRIVVVSVNKNTGIFMAFCIPPLTEVEKRGIQYYFLRFKID